MIQLSKANFNNNAGNWVKIIAYAEKKINADRGDLNVLYDIENIPSETLDAHIINRKKEK